MAHAVQVDRHTDIEPLAGAADGQDADSVAELVEGLGLSDRETAFVLAYTIGPTTRFNATASVKSFANHKTDASAAVYGATLLSRNKVKDACRRVWQAISSLEPIKARLEADSTVDAPALLAQCLVRDEDNRLVLDWDKAVSTGLTRYIRKVTPTRQGDSIELLDPHRAAELVGKFAGAFVQRIALSRDTDLSTLTEEQLRAIADGRTPE
jgi:hypothetical protein